MEVPHKTNNGSTIRSSGPAAEMCPKGSHVNVLKGPLPFSVTAALFTVAKIWNQPMYPSTDVWIGSLQHASTME